MVVCSIASILMSSAVVCVGLQPATDAERVSVPAAIARVVGAHRFAPVSQRVTLVATDAHSQVTSDVTVRLIAASTSGVGARLRLDLGRLVIYADDNRLVALHTQNNEQYFEAPLAGLTPASLAQSLPPLPLPPVDFAFAPGLAEDLAAEGRMSFGAVGEVVWQSGLPLRGEGASGKITIWPDDQWRVGRYTLERDGVTIEATVAPALGEEASRPELWLPDVSGRARVARLTDLRPLPGEIATGDRIPTLGLHRHDLSGWSLGDALESLHEQPPTANGVTAAALICVLPDGAVPTRAVKAAQRSLRWLAQEFDNQRVAGMTTAPRLIPLTVGVLEMEQITPETVAAMRARLTDLVEGPTMFHWTSAGHRTLRRIAPGVKGAAIIVVDHEQRLLGVIPLDDALADEDAFARELRALVSTPEAPRNQERLEGTGDSEEDGSRSQ